MLFDIHLYKVERRLSLGITKPVAIKTVSGPISDDFDLTSERDLFTKLKCIGVASGVPGLEYILAFHVSDSSSVQKG